MRFLRRLSLGNAGFARSIYEASDAALQLSNFYKEVASPLLSNVTFSYLPGQVDITFLLYDVKYYLILPLIQSCRNSCGCQLFCANMSQISPMSYITLKKTLILHYVKTFFGFLIVYEIHLWRIRKHYF